MWWSSADVTQDSENNAIALDSRKSQVTRSRACGEPSAEFKCGRDETPVDKDGKTAGAASYVKDCGEGCGEGPGQQGAAKREEKKCACRRVTEDSHGV